jgi:hypothetical protein
MSVIIRPTIECDHCGYLHEERTKPINWQVYNLGGWTFCSEECVDNFVVPDWSYRDEKVTEVLTTEEEVKKFIIDQDFYD